MKTIAPRNINQSAVLNRLLHHHRQFHIFLDMAALEENDTDLVDTLIEIRQFNVDCITKYSDLITQSEVRILPVKTNRRRQIRFSENDTMILNEINKHLSFLLPAYRRALSNRTLKGFPRVIVANNFEKIGLIRENLLHPVNEVYYA